MDHPSRSARAATLRGGDDNREDNTQMTGDLFLSLADAEQQSSTPTKIMNVRSTKLAVWQQN